MIGFFARQLMLLQTQKSGSQNGGFHSEYSKLNRFLSVLNLNKKSIEVSRFIFSRFSIITKLFSIVVYRTTDDI